MSTNNIDKKRIAQNTLLLYVRMAFMLLVGFYTVRLLLNTLGVTDYGIYNVIFGLVTMFTFFTNAMTVTVQRFICHEISNGPAGDPRKVFGVSIFLFLALSLTMLVLAETVGVWFVGNKLNIPPERMSAAWVVYQLSILMTLLKVMQVPYIAAITSHEDMKVYSQISILDAVLHLTSVVLLKFISADRLICFAGCYTASNLITLMCYAGYSVKKYAMCRIFCSADKSFLKSMSAFFSWNLFGAAANISKQQGLNVLLNMFCGVALNATWGIATQVGGAVSSFVGSFQQAFNPQILKSYNSADRNDYLELLQSCSKYSFMLIWLVALPVLLKTEFLLKLWLGDTLPEGAVIFTQLMVICMLIDAICGPMWVAVQATGNIKRYQVEISCIICSSFVFSLIALKLGAPAYSVALINTLVNGLTLLYRLFYLRREIDFPVRKYCLNTLLQIAVVAAISVVCGTLTQNFSGSKWYTVIIYLAAISIINLIIVLSAGLSGKERTALKAYIRKKLHSSRKD